MRFKFRKSFKIAPGVKVNFNKKSTGVTFGGKGIHYTVNSKGQRTKSVGIPGTGLYYTETNTSKKKQKSNKTLKLTNQNNEKKEEKLMSTKKWYQKSWFTILMLIIFFPAGIYLMWKHTNWNKIVKIVITVFFAFIMSVALFGDDSDTTAETGNNITTSDTTATVTEPKTSTTKTTTKETTTEATTEATTTEASTKETTTVETTTESTTKETTTKETTKAATTQTTTNYIPPVAESDEIVYVTNTGTKYHNYGCRHLKSVIEISLDDAIASGYTPCGTCH